MPDISPSLEAAGFREDIIGLLETYDALGAQISEFVSRAERSTKVLTSDDSERLALLTVNSINLMMDAEKLLRKAQASL